MRNEIMAEGMTLRVGELRAALEGLDDAVPVFVLADWKLNVTGVDAEDLALSLRVDV